MSASAKKSRLRYGQLPQVEPAVAIPYANTRPDAPTAARVVREMIDSAPWREVMQPIIDRLQAERDARSERRVASAYGVTAAAPAGTALAAGGGINIGNDKLVPISDSVVSGNSVSATTTTGSAIAQGVGIDNGGLLTLRNATVSDNIGTASGAGGVLRGGGIWNGTFPPNLPVQLTLADGVVSHNTLTASSGITVQGGGLFTTFPVILKDTLIAQNSPDQCFEC